MDGSTTAVIIIPIVTTIALALWIFMVFWADAHPRNDADAHPQNRGRGQTRPASPGITSGAQAHHIPAPRPSPDDVPGNGQVRPRGPMAVPGPARPAGRRTPHEDGASREERDEKPSAGAQADTSGEENRLVRDRPADRNAGVLAGPDPGRRPARKTIITAWPAVSRTRRKLRR
jgi:hypothetical protein